MATITLKSDLDVISRYEALVNASLGGESVYARLKDTVDRLVKDGDLSDTEKGKIVAEVLGNLSNSISSSSMQTALQWASNEKDIELKKLELAKQMDILDAEAKLRDAQVLKAKWEGISIQASTERLYGKPSVVNGVVMSLSPTGKVLAEIDLLGQQVLSAKEEVKLIKSRLDESYAAVHKTVADTIVNYGPWIYEVGPNGVTTASQGSTSMIPLSDVQRTIAKEQARGYAWNAWANAATSSAGMLGTAIASEGDIPRIEELTLLWIDVVKKLKDAKAVSFPGDLP